MGCPQVPPALRTDQRGGRAAGLMFGDGSWRGGAGLKTRQETGGADEQWGRYAQALWRSNGKPWPSECETPFAVLASKGGLPPALRWERIDLSAGEWNSAAMRAAAQGQVKGARHVHGEKDQQPQAEGQFGQATVRGDGRITRRKGYAECWRGSRHGIAARVRRIVSRHTCGNRTLAVSNRGGCPLAVARPGIHARVPMADAGGSKSAGWMDGVIRSGQDVLRAVALGAKGTLIGRPFRYGLGAMGEAGVTRCLEIIRNELDISMAFCGHTDIHNVDRGILLPGSLPLHNC
mgnify:CR=1 FL=1